MNIDSEGDYSNEDRFDRNHYKTYQDAADRIVKYENLRKQRLNAKTIDKVIKGPYYSENEIE